MMLVKQIHFGGYIFNGEYELVAEHIGDQHGHQQDG